MAPLSFGRLLLATTSLSGVAKGICSAPDCDKPARNRGWCWGHYARNRRHGDPLAGGPSKVRHDPTCSFPGCSAPHLALGLCSKHYGRSKRHGDPARAYALRDPLDSIDRTDGCWYWTDTLDRHGYGQWSDPETHKNRRAHRVVYEVLVGPIPAGLTLDHECHNQDDTCPGGTACFHRSCVRPDHLVPRTTPANSAGSPRANAKKTYCPRGHPYTPENTYISARGERSCITCRREVTRRRNRKE